MSSHALRVDWPSCKAHGVCAEILPEVLSLDRWGYPVQVVGFGPNSQAAVARARSFGFSTMSGSLTPDWRRPFRMRVPWP